MDKESGKELDRDEEGEILIRGPQIMKGYMNNATATENMIVDGWLHSGATSRLQQSPLYRMARLNGLFY